VQRTLAELLPGRDVALDPALREAFARHAWPGNIRQMVNALRTATALLGDDEALIGRHHLPDDLADDLAGDLRATASPAKDSAEDPADAPLRALAGRAVQQAVQASGGNLSEAARRLGIGRNTLYRQLRRAGPAGSA
jgi:sigma-54 dependent transcriptional regulator, acetoin dehydrogenase operon transcriptional activator AcoR